MNQEINKALDILQHGGLILYPTDTIWGIGCDATNATAIRRIYDLKKRDDAKSLIILLDEAKSIFRYVASPHPDIVGMVQGFDRPTTVIYDQAIGLPDNLVNADGSIAIRVTKDPFCKSLIKRLKHPLVSTSANTSGLASPKGFDDIEASIKQGVDYIVDHRREEQNETLPSRILRIGSDGKVAIIRD
ncbi:L-threonylcarbamoyladenylate synthase [Taibaiella koreensis]|uniref:L-threonylcarbamoyladenylate synthase n=1 Tax=Taibaiella koreensis TaxID=1268548 RepID=UPI000E59FBF6|nr:L-threonylcarbamoyladenylate synthase [Taibaiella koreensis]